MRTKCLIALTALLAVVLAGGVFSYATGKAKTDCCDPGSSCCVACCDDCCEDCCKDCCYPGCCPECIACCAEDGGCWECYLCCIEMGCDPSCCFPAAKAEAPRKGQAVAPKKPGNCGDGCCKDGCK